MGAFKKQEVLSPRSFFEVAQTMSKGALIDLAWCLLEQLHGEEELRATGGEPELVSQANPVLQARGDRWINLGKIKAQRHVNAMRRHEQVVRASIEANARDWMPCALPELAQHIKDQDGHELDLGVIYEHLCLLARLGTLELVDDGTGIWIRPVVV